MADRRQTRSMSRHSNVTGDGTSNKTTQKTKVSQTRRRREQRKVKAYPEPRRQATNDKLLTGVVHQGLAGDTWGDKMFAGNTGGDRMLAGDTEGDKMLTGDLFAGDSDLSYQTPVWVEDVGQPLVTLVYDPDHQTLWGRPACGGGFWRMRFGSENGYTRSIGFVFIEGMPAGYGMCLDTRRSALVTCDGNRFQVYSEVGILLIQKELPSIGRVADIAYCRKKNRYIIGHSDGKLTELDAVDLSIIEKRELNFPNVFPLYMTHTEDPCRTTIAPTINETVLVKTEDRTFSMACGVDLGHLIQPRGTCYDSRGSLIICDSGHNRIIRGCKDGSGVCHWEVLIPPELMQGVKPSCVVLVDDRYLLVTGEDTLPHTLTCYHYNTNKQQQQ